MPEYFSPGVYVEEVERGAVPLAGVGTSTAGFLGPTERGPVEPQLITNFTEFQRIYGGFDLYQTGKRLNGTYLAYAVEGFFRNGGGRCYVGRISGVGQNQEISDREAKFTLRAPKEGDEETDPEVITARAVGPGSWGNNVVLLVGNATNGEDLFKLTVRYWTDATSSEEDNEGPFSNVTNELQNNPNPEPAVEEVYDDLSMEPTDPRFFENVVNDASKLVTLQDHGRTRRPKPYPAPDTEEPVLTGGGETENINVSHYEGKDDPGRRTGLSAFAAIDDIAIVYVPPAVPKAEETERIEGLSDAVKQHCERLKDRFAVLDGPEAEDITKLSNDGPPLQSKFAAYYVPWIQIRDSATDRLRFVPPGGHVVGIYARSDRTRGVHKAPANEVVQGAQDLRRNITTAQQDTLNPKGINCIRNFPSRGIRIWGARTTSDNPLWQYVNVRRLFSYLEESIDEGIQWVVFEPNDEKLWARVRQTISNFLTDVWRDGALKGTTAEEAFYVRCDETTMSENDIATGKLVVEVGIAPVRPAEFVVVRITQLTGSAQAA